MAAALVGPDVDGLENAVDLGVDRERLRRGGGGGDGLLLELFRIAEDLEDIFGLIAGLGITGAVPGGLELAD